MRSERFARESEIKRVLKKDVAGPIFMYEKGERYSHNGEGHTLILGCSGVGKSRRGTIPLALSIIENGESGIIVDPKGEIYKNTKDKITDDYEVVVINFRELTSGYNYSWNPLMVGYELWKHGNEEEKNYASQIIEEISHSIYPVPINGDPFWAKEARNVFIASVYTLFEFAKPEEINLGSVFYLINNGEEPYFGNKFSGTTYLKKLIEDYPEKEDITMQLKSFITTANETKGGIRSSFLNGLSVFTKSKSLREYLSGNDLKINELTGDKPTLIYAILPDETPIYDDLIGVLISQLMNHYVRMAESKYDGKLPIKLNVILEELGNVGSSIPNLPHLLSAGRSRNIRVAIVLQSISQLIDIYGKSKASTIASNCDVRFAFRVNDWDTLNELSRMCGEKEIMTDVGMVKEPLITPSQLQAMETGQALVIISGRTKFITSIPDFTEMFDLSKKEKFVWGEKKKQEAEYKYFDIKEFFKQGRTCEEKIKFNLPKDILGLSEDIKSPEEGIEEILEHINARLAAEEIKESKTNRDRDKERFESFKEKYKKNKEEEGKDKEEIENSLKKMDKTYEEAEKARKEEMDTISRDRQLKRIIDLAKLEDELDDDSKNSENQEVDNKQPEKTKEELKTFRKKSLYKKIKDFVDFDDELDDDNSKNNENHEAKNQLAGSQEINKQEEETVKLRIVDIKSIEGTLRILRKAKKYPPDVLVDIIQQLQNKDFIIECESMLEAVELMKSLDEIKTLTVIAKDDEKKYYRYDCEKICDPVDIQIVSIKYISNTARIIGNELNYKGFRLNGLLLGLQSPYYVIRRINRDKAMEIVEKLEEIETYAIINDVIIE